MTHYYFKAKAMKKLFLNTVITGLLMVTYARAQDPVFSQPFLSPIYLNPAATGTGDYDLRLSAMYHRHWWSIPSNITYTAFSVDKFVPSLSSGFGLLGTHSSEGYLKKTGIYGSFARTFCSDGGSVSENSGTPKWFFTGGFQLGFVQARINYDQLVFFDQLTPTGIIPGLRTGADVPVNSGKWRPDISAGLFFNYNLSDNYRLLFGFSSHHLNRPDQSLTATADTFRSQLPVRWTGNFLFTHSNEDGDWSYSICGIYYRQAQYGLKQFGVEVTQNEYDISMGLWYRINDNKYSKGNSNAFTLTFAISLFNRADNNHLKAGVAHDFITGGNGYSYTTGNSELGLVWDKNTYNQPANDPCKAKINTYGCPNVIKVN